MTVELDSIERMYADDLFDAVSRAEAGEETWITRGGVRVAKVVPATQTRLRQDQATKRMVCEDRATCEVIQMMDGDGSRE